MSEERVKENIQTWLKALEAERQYQKEELGAELSGENIHLRVKEGLCRYPCSLESSGYTLGEMPIVVLEKGDGKKVRDHFQPGQPVRLFRYKENTLTHESHGIVHWIHKEKAKIILHEEDLPLWVAKGGVGMDLLHDEKTVDQMKSSMEFLSGMKKSHPLFPLVDFFYGSKSERDWLPETQISASGPNVLNESQQRAIAGAMSADLLSVIHGPPGTGKTTTLLQLIIKLIAEKKKILVAAPSNAAVDWIAGLLFREGVKVVRIGHLSRIDKEVLECSLESRIFAQNEAGQIKKIRLRAEECRRQASKYRRNFGKQQRDERRDLYREARELSAWAVEIENRLIEEVIDQAEVVCCTLSGADSPYLRDLIFDFCLIDEAAQALQGACWIAMLRAKNVVLAGDHRQLPPTVKCHDPAKTTLETTLLDLAMRLNFPMFLLDTQYRMNRVIMGFSNQWFYEGKLKAADSVADHRLKTDAENRMTIEFIDTAGCGFSERLKAGSNSFFNKDEYLIIREHLDPLLHRLYPEIPSVGIISPYKAQVKHILEDLEEEQLPFEVQAATIDSFQGQEKEIIYISLVRSNDEQKIGFLKDYRRMNVAMTRARKKLVIIGDSATIGNDPFYGQLLDYIESRGWYRSAWEFMG